MMRGACLVVLFLAACTASVAKPAPRVSGQTFEGASVAFGAPAEKPTLVVFWATWCSICRSEMPKLVKLTNERGAELGIIGVNVDTDVAEAKRFLEEHPLPYPNVSDPALVVADAFGAQATPTLVLVDREGNEIERGHDVDAVIARLQP